MEIKEAVDIYARPYSSSRNITIPTWFQARAIVLANPKETKKIGKVLTKTKEIE